MAGRHSTRRLTLAGALLGIGLLALPAQAPAGRAVEFSRGISPGAQPFGITAGPDGNMWFTENADGVASITASGVVTEYRAGISRGATPTGITAGPGGTLWFTERAGRIGRVGPNGIEEFSAGISSGAEPNDITAGPDGALWFTERNGIGRITTDGVITEFTAGITPGALPWEITTGPDGNIWFTETQSGGIGRIGRDGSVTEFYAGMRPGAAPLGIAPGPDGNVWFTDATGAIGRITPLGVITMKVISADSRPTAIARGPDDNIWFTEGAGRIGRIDASGAVLEFTNGITADSGLVGLVAGHDGNLWFTEQQAGRIGRIGTNTTAFVTQRANRRGAFKGYIVSLQVSEARGTPVSVVCVRGCSRHRLRGVVPRDPAKPPYATLRYRPRLRVGPHTELEIRAEIAARLTRYERYRFRRGKKLTPQRIGAGCLRSQAPRRPIQCPS